MGYDTILSGGQDTGSENGKFGIEGKIEACGLETLGRDDRNFNATGTGDFAKSTEELEGDVCSGSGDYS